MTELLEDAMRQVASLPKEEQDAIAAQILQTLHDEAAWQQALGRSPEKLRLLAETARQEGLRGETRPLDEIL
jgi:predicted ArsR family transcriptional regulator